MKCDCCGEGNVTKETYLENYLYKGVDYELTMHYKLCDYCGSEYAGKEECDAVDEQIRKIKESVK